MASAGDPRRVCLRVGLMIVSITRRAKQDDKEALVAKFSERIAKRELPPQASKVIEEELAKLQLLEPASSEFNVTRNYLDWLTSLPWGVFSEENYSLRHAEQVRVPRPRASEGVL